MESFSESEVAMYYRTTVPALRQHGADEWRGACPVHQGEHDSFSVNATTGLASCHSQCGKGWDIIELQRALTGQGFKHARNEIYRIVGRALPTNGTRRREVAAYPYTEATGKLIFEVVRFDPKGFAQRKPGAAGRKDWSVKGLPVVPYHLPKIVDAETVYVVEGEKDVHTLEELGLVATCNAGGAGKWKPAHAQFLTGKHVVILPDNDAPGQQHAVIVAASLRALAASVRVVNLPVAEKGDVTDWKNAGGTLKGLLELVAATAPETDTTRQANHILPKSGGSGPTYSGEPYSIDQGCLYVWKRFGETHTPSKVANFTARIVLEQVMDDGVEQSRVFTVEANVAGRTIRADVTAKEFRTMNWVSEKLGGMAIVSPGQTEQVRAAIQSLSGQIPTRHTYNHTGWRIIDSQHYYLHSGGGIGRTGNRPDICVSLDADLSNYTFPDPPDGDRLVAAIRASLRMLDVTLDRLTFPVYSAVFRAILGPAPFSIHVNGSSGAGKSQLAALAQQHFGRLMDGDHLPASWIGTANANGTLAFHAKDALLVVDDFVPSGNSASQQKIQGDADRLLRSQGNGAGRSRLSAEGKLKGNRPPRGLLFSTGEDTPKGRSLNARLVLLQFPKGAMDWKCLTECQAAAFKGEMAGAMAGFIRWLAPQLSEIQQSLEERKFARRSGATASAVHMRTPENLDSLHFGFIVFLDFARCTGALSEREARVLLERAEKAFTEVADGEQRKHADNEPARYFLRLIRTAVAMGRAHLAGRDGKAPAGDRPWGWHSPAGGIQRGGRGTKIGWVDGDDIYLLPDAAHTVAFRLAQEQGDVLPGSPDTIKRDLKEQSLLERSDEKRRTTTIRRTLEREQHDVLYLRYQIFQTGRTGFADDADISDKYPDDNDELQ